MFRRKSTPPSLPDTALSDAVPPDDGDQPSSHRAAIGRKTAGKLARNPMVQRLESDTLTLYTRQHLASAQECAALRAIIDAGAQPSVLFSGSASADYRTSDSCHMDPGHKLVSTITARISALMGMDPSYGETIQGQRYRPGQEYKFHCDYFPVDASYWPQMRAQGGQRCWTAMLYLNSLDGGGETVFPQGGFAITPQEGQLLIWNNLRKDGSPNPDTLHAAQPVTSGIKYVLTQWFREQPWLATRR